MKFRMVKIDNETEIPRLHIGMTTYKDAQAFRSKLTVPITHQAKKLAVGGVLETLDGKIIVQKRAAWVNSAPGMWSDSAGGHPEPKNVDLFTSDYSIKQTRIANEIFGAQKDEISAELNVPLENLVSHQLHAVIEVPYKENPNWSRPLSYFITKTDLTSDKIVSLYNRGGSETDESEFIKVWNCDEVLTKFRKIYLEFSMSGICSLAATFQKKKLTTLSIPNRSPM